MNSEVEEIILNEAKEKYYNDKYGDINNMSLGMQIFYLGKHYVYNHLRGLWYK